MKEQNFFRLQASETSIAAMASRIFSSYIVAGKITDQNETEMVDKSISLAIDMARKVENLIDSDSERSEETNGMVM